MSRKIYGLGGKDFPKILAHWIFDGAILYTIFGLLHLLPLDVITFTLTLIIVDLASHNIIRVD